ncbi:putative glycosyltransferase EpsJ [Muribaculaceae bacterium]|jgi:glycosyltransferase involved in cell wall biosynthesis|uniref:glycosyltransferase family 2 protein n=1 Tax=uncultured Duncaniella sp. TaxID=2768039 RepID=UPI0014340FED|nr:glycosyltransferase family 2 protein [uncultured Duncaniella sp.]MCX4259858.1 glycosyltransferase family 2 protein [Muribaculaceae bacterium]GFI06475.1 putative glycosyltransferase EpsJ [Muribaculaceae bacterium]
MLVSIIIPIYNISGYLRDCLDSCLRQTYKNVEFICVDDGSTDGSGEMADEYALDDPRFKVIHKPNGGLPSARKAGVEAASGDYLFHLDGDDDLPDNAIELLVNVAKSENADIVAGDYNMFDTREEKTYCDCRIEHALTGEEYLLFIMTQGLFNVWGKLIRRSLYLDNDVRIPANISIGEDLVAMTQLAFFSTKVCPCQSAVYNYYIRPTSMSKVTGNVTGALADRAIFAVEFVLNFLAPRVDDGLQWHLTEFVKRFVYEYMQSPYPVSLRRNELNRMLSFLKKQHFGRRSFSSLICTTAYYNLSLSKVITKFSILLKR